MRHKKANVELQLIIWTRESHANVVNVRGTLKFCFLRWPESHPWNLAGKKVSIIWCIIETISTRYCRKFKKLKGLYDHYWQVLEAGSCCVKAKRACAGAGKCFLSTVDQITVTWSRPRNTLIFFGLYIRSPVNQYLMQHQNESRHLPLRLFFLSTVTRQIGSCWKS